MPRGHNPQGRAGEGSRAHLTVQNPTCSSSEMQRARGRKENIQESLCTSGHLGGKDPTREGKRREPKRNRFYSPKQKHRGRGRPTGDSVLPFQQKSGITEQSQMKSPAYFLMYFPADGLHFPVMISCKAYLKNKRPVLVRTARLGKPQSTFHPGTKPE